MSTGSILALGLVAGGTIFLGLPVGRLRGIPTTAAALLNAGAAGVLLFLLVETLEHGFEPVEDALEHVTAGSGGTWTAFLGRALLFATAFGVGLLGLVFYERWMGNRGARATAGIGPGAASVRTQTVASRVAMLTAAQRLALFIAVGIGLHNFAEGLAIGQSAASDEISLAVLLVVGFGLHNATEGFGIVGPLAAAREVPTWPFLGLLGVIGGGPTFLGTIVGQSFVNETVASTFLALAAGSILYVIVQLVAVGLRFERRDLLMWGLFAGVVLGFGTELVLVAAGL